VNPDSISDHNVVFYHRTAPDAHVIPDLIIFPDQGAMPGLKPKTYPVSGINHGVASNAGPIT
jgi:hypothetical protein